MKKKIKPVEVAHEDAACDEAEHESVPTVEIKPPKRKPAFSKEKLISMKRYKDNADLLTALLEADKTYTLDVVDALIGGFLNSFPKKGTVE